MENRETFLQRISWLSSVDIHRIMLAYTLAKFEHRAQTRKERSPEGRPLRYFEHPRRVALILMDEVNCYLPEVIIGCLLHDGPEDTRGITFDMIHHIFGSEVEVFAKLLTKTEENKDLYVDGLFRYGTWKVLAIKACDRLDNLRSLAAGSVEFQKKQIEETRKKYFPVFDRMVELTPTDYVVGVRTLRNKIVSLTDSLASSLGI